MNVIRFAHVDRDGQTGVGQSFGNLGLGFANLGPAADGVRVGRQGAEVGELHDVERKITLVPLLPPVTDHALARAARRTYALEALLSPWYQIAPRMRNWISG